MHPALERRPLAVAVVGPSADPELNLSPRVALAVLKPSHGDIGSAEAKLEIARVDCEQVEPWPDG